MRITPKGRELYEDLVALGDAMIEKAFCGISHSQKEELSRVLQTIYENLQSPKS